MNNVSKNKVRNNILKVGSKNLSTENWEVYHPNGTHMFTCGEKKAAWYLKKGLAERTDGGKIMLNFIPKGFGFEDNEIFGKSVRKSICVVSGVGDNLQRHHIVPYCYRNFFPEEFKSKNHHDVVLINFEKHSDYERIATQFKDEIGKMYGVKSIAEFNVEYTGKLRECGKSDAIILNNLHSLFKTYGNLKQNILIEKIKQISAGTGIPFETVCGYNYIQLYKMYQIVKERHDYEVDDFKKNQRKYYDHGYHVVSKLDTDEKLVEFIKLWRTHFIETMKPKFMPTGWSIDFRTKTII